MHLRGANFVRGVGALLAGVGIVAWLGWWLRPAPVADDRGPEAGRALSSAALPPWPPSESAGQASVRDLQSIASALRSAASAATGEALLTELRQRLAALPPTTAAAAIDRFLATHDDAPTRLGFIVGGAGMLDAAPTLRVFLLDWLARVDRPGAAAWAERILATMDSPDEWAVSLRNYAWAGATDERRAFLLEKTAQLLQHEPWLAQPTAGFLEAFDVAVHYGGTNLVPVLAAHLRQADSRTVAHAAYLALDRLVIREPATILDLLARTPDLLAERNATRAQFFARANMADPNQRALLERYLLDPTRAPSELDAFTGLFPSADFMLSQNLLTQTTTPDGVQLAAQDHETLRVVEVWLADPRFAPRTAQLQSIQRRLQRFLGLVEDEPPP